MKALFHFTAPLLALITMIACTELEVSENPQNSNNELLQKLSITGKDFKFDGKTRSSVNIGESGASFTWDEDDVIGIFPDKGDQVSFAMDEGAGTQTATFSGGGWALKSSAKYAAYYPHVYENRNLTAIPVSYVGQTQNGNGNTDHIGAYDFMAAGVSTPENGAVAFDMQHLGALVQLTITVPEPSTLTKVVLTSSTEFTETGTIDLTADRPAITADTQSNTFEIALNNIATTEANENVTVYFMLAPVDLSDSELTVTVHFADATLREVELTGKNLQAGKAYKLSAEIKVIPNYQIWYTSTYGKISPDSDAFGVAITSNVYQDGEGIITFDGDVRKIGADAFIAQDRLASITLPNSVKSIGREAFASCTSLTSITMSKNIVTIGENAFEECSSLITVTIPNSMTNIENEVFMGCTSLTSLTIPNSVTSIGVRAFEDCTSLTSLTIPNSVATIADNAFNGCNSLSSIVVEEGNSIYDSRDNCNAIIETSSNTLISGCKSTIIPNNVTTIGTVAFAGCTSLTSITIPNSVINIEGVAFSGCSSLTSIIIPSNVTEIGFRAFKNCTSLTLVEIKATTPPTINSETFSNCGDDIKFYVPAESINAYKAADYWKDLNIQSK